MSGPPYTEVYAHILIHMHSLGFAINIYVYIAELCRSDFEMTPYNMKTDNSL